MNSFEIKRENTDGDILLEVKKEGDIKKEEDGNMNQNFETVFLPEMYEGVAMETPFFDFHSYKKRWGLITEDNEIDKPNLPTDVGRYNFDNNVYHKFNKIEDAQVTSENMFIFDGGNSMQNIHMPVYNSYTNLDTTDYFRHRYENSSRIPMNNLQVILNCNQEVCMYNTHVRHNVYPSRDPNTYQNGCTFVQDSNIQGERDCICCDSRKRIRRKSDDYSKSTVINNLITSSNVLDVDQRMKQQIEREYLGNDWSGSQNAHVANTLRTKKTNSGVFDIEDEVKGQIIYHNQNNSKQETHKQVTTPTSIPTQASNNEKTKTLKNSSVNMRIEPVDEKTIFEVQPEEKKYKCPLCKRPRVFSTLTAVNNHLKFEHITIFSSKSGKSGEKTISQAEN